MTRSGAGNRFRTRKLSTKQSLAVLRENQIDSVDDDAQRNIPQIETGVERQEEIEHHLQAAISASQAAAVGAKVTQIFIPTPDASDIPIKRYESLYPKKFSQPASYIRFSSTVEDCSGTAYCMSAEDEKYLEKLNAVRRSSGPPCTEDQFEFIVDQFENTIQSEQPYLSVGFSGIMSWEAMESFLNGVMDAHLKHFAKSIYSYWKDQKIARGGRPIIPVLKFEQGNEKDDGDPYVCFRRREVRQVRKTRRTDAQSTDKLKKLRQDLDTARNLVKDVLQRETMRKNSFAFEHSIFETRRQLIEFKRKAGIKGDDEDLVNHKKRRPVEAVPPAIRIPIRQDGKPPEAELRQLAAVKAEAERSRQEKYNQIRSSRLAPKHGVVDFTEDTLFMTPRPPPVDPATKFCGVQTYYLPSPPPSSASSVSSPSANLPTIDEAERHVSIVQASPQREPSRDIPSFRRRRGRGGRTVIDRRGPAFIPSDYVDPLILDRMKYDEDEEDIHPPIYHLDPNSNFNIQFRARMLSPPPELVHGNAPLQSMRRSIMSSPIAHGPLPPSSGLQTTVSNSSHVVNGQQTVMMNSQQSPRVTLYPMVNGQHPNINPSNPIPQVTVNGHSSPTTLARR